MNNDFVKTLKAYHIAYLPELPSKDIKVDVNTVVAIPSKKRGQFKIFTWCNDDWEYTASIDKSDFDLKDAYDDLSNAVKKLIKISANTEDEELSSKLSKITTKILQAKYELADDVIDPFENSLKVGDKE